MMSPPMRERRAVFASIGNTARITGMDVHHHTKAVADVFGKSK